MWVILSPKPPVLRFDDRARHSQPDPHAALLRSHKNVEDLFDILNSRTLVDHLYDTALDLSRCPSLNDAGT